MRTASCRWMTRAPLGALLLLLLGGALLVAGRQSPPEEENGGNVLFTNDKNDRLEVLYEHDVHVKSGIKCEVCHEKIFKKQVGGNEFLMKDIFAGRFCGTCHHAKASEHRSFAPQKNCSRCHRVRLRNKEYDLEAIKTQAG